MRNFHTIEKTRYVIGIDEVGRGALCGSVTVAAFVFLRNAALPSHAEGTPLRDSKRLTPRARGKWFRAVKEAARTGEMAFATARVAPHVVDRVNIRNAANLAATRAYERLVAKTRLSPSSLTVLLDGGLFIRPRERFVPRAARTMVRGDEKIPEIQLASIVAKVTRDRAMVRLHARYPSYGFAAHKGYGTLFHRRALRAHGPIKGRHRLTFISFLSDRRVGARKQ
ncbi:MAG: ribonuclease HII [Candidatus Jorgensenbacteria bacterium]|nr:ribonuclease HII [Candidatus Jorgensenbacteria bacterium]